MVPSVVRSFTASAADVRHLLRFRAATVRRRGAARWLFAGLLVVTAAVAIVPAFGPGADAQVNSRAVEVTLLLPAGFAAFLALAVISAVVSGGGRELLPRDQAVPYPISPTSDHLGALLLAPVNIAWLIQAWVLLGSAAYVFGPDGLAAGQVVVLLWLAGATAVGQVVAWTVEAVRRRRHGQLVVRGIAVALVGATGLLHLQDRLMTVLDSVPTVWFVYGALSGPSWRWALTLAVALAVVVVAVLAGVVPAHLAARRAPRDELRVESETRAARRTPRSDLLALIRTDRSSVWRTVPMRRGLMVLAVGPGLIAVVGNLTWPTMTILPGLVASGAALLFGVNAWCLDGRGGLWRESLPVPPGLVFGARTWVLAEFLVVASVVTVLLGSLRAGAPTTAELASLVCALVVVTVQVVGGSMRWSAHRPYAVDLRSARATPAPPMAMVGYSSRLAVSTTLTGVAFSTTAQMPVWELSVLLATPMLAWSTVRLVRTLGAWRDPMQRARVVTVVAA